MEQQNENKPDLLHKKAGQHRIQKIMAEFGQLEQMANMFRGLDRKAIDDLMGRGLVREVGINGFVGFTPATPFFCYSIEDVVYDFGNPKTRRTILFHIGEDGVVDFDSLLGKIETTKTTTGAGFGDAIETTIERRYKMSRRALLRDIEERKPQESNDEWFRTLLSKDDKGRMLFEYDKKYIYTSEYPTADKKLISVQSIKYLDQQGRELHVTNFPDDLFPGEKTSRISTGLYSLDGVAFIDGERTMDLQAFENAIKDAEEHYVRALFEGDGWSIDSL